MFLILRVLTKNAYQGFFMNQADKMIRHLKKIENKSEKIQVRNIDFIYLINLDVREEKLEKSTNQFAQYDIHPHRFSAILGWGLEQETFDDIAMPVLGSTSFDRPVHFGPAARLAPGERINRSSLGKYCVHHNMSAGALGCYLSHLSVLSDACHSCYQTIWVLEDDITVAADPNMLSVYIDKLDALVGPSEWDILYTDNEDHLVKSTLKEVMGGGAWGRPGISLTDSLLEYRPVGSDFIKIGGRHHAHSMIVRQSGIQKILNFVTRQGMFRPYDIEIAFIPDLKLYNLSRDIVHGRNRSISDTSNPPEIM
jgi:hypothetical protein